MRSANLPIWMRSRVPREDSKNTDSPKTRGNVVLLALLIIFATLSAFSGLRHAPYFHLPIIAAGFTAFALAVHSNVRCSLRNLEAFVIAAVSSNLAMVFIAHRIGDDTAGAIAVAGVVLFTGLIALLLFSRMDAKPSWRTRAAVFATALAFTLIGPLFHLFSATDGLMGVIAGWFLVATIPMIFVTFMTFMVVNAYHKSEITLPSDKWS